MWTAERPAVLVLFQLLLGLVRWDEEVLGIKIVVADELEHVTVVSIRAGLCHDT